MALAVEFAVTCEYRPILLTALPSMRAALGFEMIPIYWDNIAPLSPYFSQPLTAD